MRQICAFRLFGSNCMRLRHRRMSRIVSKFRAVFFITRLILVLLKCYNVRWINFSTNFSSEVSSMRKTCAKQLLKMKTVNILVIEQFQFLLSVIFSVWIQLIRTIISLSGQQLGKPWSKWRYVVLLEWTIYGLEPYCTKIWRSKYTSNDVGKSYPRKGLRQFEIEVMFIKYLQGKVLIIGFSEINDQSWQNHLSARISEIVGRSRGFTSSILLIRFWASSESLAKFI